MDQYETAHGARLCAHYLQRAVSAWLAEPAPHQWMGLLSEFYGAYVAVPVNEFGQPVTYVHEGQLAVPAHTRREAVPAWCARIGLQESPRVNIMLGDELLEYLAARHPDHCVVLDPQEAGIAIYPVDEYVAGYSRFGRLKAALRRGEEGYQRPAGLVIQELLKPGAEIVYMLSPGSGLRPGEQPYPQLVNKPADGVGVGNGASAGDAAVAGYAGAPPGGVVACPLFTSALEVFRFQPQAGAAQTSVEWFRRYLPAGLAICIDPAADGKVIELSAQELNTAGFWL